MDQETSGPVSASGSIDMITGLPSPAGESRALPLVMARKHYSRLRAYFENRHYGRPVEPDAIDLALVGVGYITRVERNSSRPTFAITESGELELAAENMREIARRLPHHDLGSRLAAWVRSQRRITWENIQLGVPLPTGGKLILRPDLFSLATVYDAKRICPWIHEVKVSRADFLADLAKPEKRGGYSLLCERLYYAAPAGLILPEEVPADCGLVEEIKAGEFAIIKQPKKRRVELSVHTFMELILKPGTFTPL